MVGKTRVIIIKKNKLINTNENYLHVKKDFSVKYLEECRVFDQYKYLNSVKTRMDRDIREFQYVYKH